MGNIKDLNYYENMLIDLFGENPYIIEIPPDYDPKLGGQNRVNFTCKKCGDTFNRRLGDLCLKCKQGNKPVCKNCADIEKRKYFDEKVNKSLQKFLDEYGDEYEILGEFKGTDASTKIKCKLCGNIFNGRISNIKKAREKDGNHYCKKCNVKRMKTEYTHPVEYYEKKLIEKEGKLNYKINKFTSSSDISNFTCLICNHTFDARMANVLQARIHYCPKCNNMVRDTRSYPERVADVNETIIPLEDYINLRTPILHKCLKCKYEWYPTPTNILKGEGCPNCNRKSYESKGELEVYEYVNKISSKMVFKHDRSVIAPRELDMYIPERNVAIEYSGLYWHNENNKGKNYHLEKLLECENKKVRLIQIFEDEWKHKRVLVEKKLKYILKETDDLPNINSNSCYIKEISYKKASKFLDKYHLQGKDTSKIRLGLYATSPKTKKNILVSVMTFCKPRPALGLKDSDYDYELSRFASTYNYVIEGAFSKLLTYFKENYEWNKLITYADRRWSNGEVYAKNGWTHSHSSKPNYWYVQGSHGTIRYHRYQFRKSKLKELFPNTYSDNKSERKIMEENKYYRIYDCGNDIYVYTR